MDASALLLQELLPKLAGAGERRMSLDAEMPPAMPSFSFDTA